MTFIADFIKSTFWKAFNPKIFSSIQPVASFETNPASISSKMVEFDTFDCLIAFPQYVIAKFPAKLHVVFFHFFGIWICHTPSYHFENCQFPPMAIDGILKNFSHRWPRIDHTWPPVGSVGLQWPSVRCHGVSVWVVIFISTLVILSLCNYVITFHQWNPILKSWLTQNGSHQWFQGHGFDQWDTNLVWQNTQQSALH